MAIIKEAVEDWKRHKQDVEVNNRAVDVFDHQENKFVSKVWRDVRVGDIIIVCKDQYFPAGEGKASCVKLKVPRVLCNAGRRC